MSTTIPEAPAFCARRTPDEYKEESKKATAEAMKNLNLGKKKNFFHKSSDEDDGNESDITLENRSNRKRRRNSFETENHYLKLDLSNKITEIIELTEELDELRKMNIVLKQFNTLLTDMNKSVVTFMENTPEVTYMNSNEVILYCDKYQAIIQELQAKYVNLNMSVLPLFTQFALYNYYNIQLDLCLQTKHELNEKRKQYVLICNIKIGASMIFAHILIMIIFYCLF